MTSFLKLNDDYIINEKFIKSIKIYNKISSSFFFTGETKIIAEIIIANTRHSIASDCNDEILNFEEGSNEFNKLKDYVAKIDDRMASV